MVFNGFERRAQVAGHQLQNNPEKSLLANGRMAEFQIEYEAEAGSVRADGAIARSRRGSLRKISR